MNASWSSGLALVALVVGGCSSDDTTSLGGGGDAGFFDAASDAAIDAIATSDVVTSDAAPGEAGDANDRSCMSTTTKSACTACCTGFHTAGVATFNGAVAACGCQASTCQTPCATTLCAQNPAQPDQACTNCLAPKVAQGGVCYQPILTACEADSDCVAYFACTGANGANCSAKP